MVILKVFENRVDYENNTNAIEEIEMEGVTKALELARVKVRGYRSKRKKDPSIWGGCKIITFNKEELYRLPLC